ncbi:MAG: protease HtpX [Steroidobacteraceae bacterium]
MKRIVLYLATNFAIVLMLSFVARLLGLDQWMTQRGMQMGPLLAMAALMGFGGSFISLAMSKWIAKRTMGLTVIGDPRTEEERWLVETVRRLAQKAGIGMPEVAWYDSPDMNAFATGMNRNAALVAVSSGLVRRMRRDEVEAVLGHEIGHVANGDMVTLALIQGVVNTFVFVLARVIGNFVDRATNRDSNGRGMGYFATVMIAEMVLGLLASIIVMWFSRYREFRADHAGATLANRDSMIGALEALKRAHTAPLPGQMAAFGISGGLGAGLKKLFMTHPPLDERIAALRNARG